MQRPCLAAAAFGSMLGSGGLRAGVGIFPLSTFLYNTDYAISQENHRDGCKVTGINQELQQRKVAFIKLSRDELYVNILYTMIPEWMTEAIL